jgi:CRP/FNR family transcriptional regulator, cyclic AMP receptor protein
MLTVSSLKCLAAHPFALITRPFNLKLAAVEQLVAAQVDKTTAQDFASHHGWLSQMPPGFRRAVQERVLFRAFKAEETIHIAGDDPAGMYGLVDGTIRVVLAGSEHGPYVVHLLRPVTWFGEGPAIIDQPRPVSLRAARSVKILYLTQRAINEIAQLDPAYWKCFVVPLMGHLDTSMGALADLMIRNTDERLVAVLLRLGGCRSVDKEGPIEVDVSQEEIATMANLSRSTAGSIMRRWELDGLLALGYGQVTILAPGRLRQRLGDGEPHVS